jgi:hypothetical protein
MRSAYPCDDATERVGVRTGRAEIEAENGMRAGPHSADATNLMGQL